MIDAAPTRRDYAAIAAILVLAAVLRVFGANSALWFDEIATVVTHLRLPWSDMMTDYEMNHHYFYSLQAKSAVVLFGEAAWSVRLPALLFGVASIAALWRLVFRISGAQVAAITALLVTLSYHHIWFSQNARGYTELMFWSVLGLDLFLKGLRRPAVSTWIWFAVVLALAVFTHLTGIFFFATMGLAWLGWMALSVLRRQPPARAQVAGPAAGFAGGLVLSLLAHLPLLPGIVRNAAEVGGTSAVDVMQEYQNPLWTLIETARTLGAQGAAAGAIVLLALGIALIGAVRLRDREPLVGFVVFGHILLTATVLFAIGMRIWPRFFFIDIGLLMFLIVEGVAVLCLVLGGWLPLFRKWLFPAAVVAMVLISVGLASRNYSAPKQDLAGAWQFVEAARAPGEEVHAVGVGALLMNEFYETGWNAITTEDDFERARASETRSWFVVPFPTRTLRQYEDLAAEGPEFEMIRFFPGTLGDGAVLVYVREPR